MCTIAPTIMDDATTIVNGDDTKERAQNALHLHQSHFKHQEVAATTLN